MPITPFNRPVAPQVSSRKKRYATDASYRETAKKISRRSYRIKENVELQSCLYSLQFLGTILDQTVLLPNGSTKEMPVASVPKTAKLLQMLYQTFWRWVNNGIVPAPILMSTQSTGRHHTPFPMYHREEIRVLIEEIGAHQKEVKYLRKDHKEVRERIEQRIAEVRKTLKIKQG